MQIHPYLTFDGNCEAAFNFYAKVFGSTIDELHRYAGSPLAAGVARAHQQRVMHANMSIGNIKLLGSDRTPDQPFAPIHGVALSVCVETAEDADRIFAALAEGGTVTMPLEPTFWAHRFGMLIDRFGTPWMINCDLPRDRAD